MEGRGEGREGRMKGGEGRRREEKSEIGRGVWGERRREGLKSLLCSLTGTVLADGATQNVL